MLNNSSENLSATGVNAAIPPHWSPQQQTARMLALCEAQMEAATQDSDSAVDVLVHAFTDLMSLVQETNAATKGDGNNAEEQTLSQEAVRQRCLTLTNQVTKAIVAFQFYDKLSQRLGHVRYSLSTLALFICDRMNSQKPEHWEKLLLTLGRLYRTAEERAIFDSIAGRLSLTSSNNHQPLSQDISPDSSIELF